MKRRTPEWLPAFVGLLALVGLAFGIGIAMQVVSVDYAIMSPGPATDVLGNHPVDGTDVPRIAINGAPTFPTSGALEFTTVRVAGGPGYPVNVVDVFMAWLDPAQDVYPAEQLFPPQATQEQVAQENRAEMASSQKEAAAVALRALGYQVPAVVRVASVASSAPSEGVLKAGDVFVSVAGRPITDSETLRAAIQSVTAGSSVTLVVRRDGLEQTLTSGTGKAEDGRTILGIMLARDYQLPFQVDIDAGNVGGPSAGLMFSLGIYDKLTDGALTGGKTVAGTGTIDDTGKVGPIGGIPQKLVGAKASGATYFLAPADNCAEVIGREPSGLTVVRVATFDEARAALEAIAADRADSLPRCAG